MAADQQTESLLKQSATWLAYIAKIDTSATNRANAAALLNEIVAVLEQRAAA